METEKCIRERRSVRKFTDQKIPHEMFEKLVEISRFAPSWKNTQVVRYHVIDDVELKEKLADECMNNFVYNCKTTKRAAALVVMTVVEKICGYEEDGSFTTPRKDAWEMFDAGCSAQNFCLAAHDNGIGTVVLGIFDAAKIKEYCNIPENENVAALIATGYPETVGKPAPPRNSVDKILSFNK